MVDRGSAGRCEIRRILVAETGMDQNRAHRVAAHAVVGSGGPMAICANWWSHEYSYEPIATATDGDRIMRSPLAAYLDAILLMSFGRIVAVAEKWPVPGYGGP